MSTLDTFRKKLGLPIPQASSDPMDEFRRRLGISTKTAPKSSASNWGMEPTSFAFDTQTSTPALPVKGTSTKSAASKIATAGKDFYVGSAATTGGTLRNTVLGVPEAFSQTVETLARGLRDQFTKPTAKTLEYEKQAFPKQPDNLLGKIVAPGQTAAKYASRLVSPMFIPWAEDYAQSKVGNQLLDDVLSGNAKFDAYENYIKTAEVFGKKPSQIIGDSALVALNLPLPGSFVGSLAKRLGVQAAERSVLPGVVPALTEGARIGLQQVVPFTVAQVLSDDVHSVDEIIQIFGSNALAFPILGAITSGAIPVSKEIFKRAVEVKARIDAIPNKQGGFIKNPLAEKTYAGEKDLTTKVLQRLEGKSAVSKQYISDLTNSADLKQPERDLIRRMLEDEGDIVSAAKFAAKVKSELLPLERVSEGAAYEGISLPDEMRGPIADYNAHVYTSPIKTSAGDVHFNRGYNSEEGQPNYFAHSRVEDLPPQKYFDAKRKASEPGAAFNVKDSASFNEPGTTRRVIEIQSDLFQKGRLEQEASWPTNKAREANLHMEAGNIKMGQKILDEIQTRNNEVAKLEPYRNTWHERVIREEVKQAAIDGKTKLQFPTGETAMKIEGLGDTTSWSDADRQSRPMSADELEVGREIVRAEGDFGPAENAERWVITDVLENVKFKAVPKREIEIQLKNNKKLYQEYYGLSRDKDPLTDATNVLLDDMRSGKLSKENLEVFDSMTETFDISGNVDKENPIFKFYEKEVGKYLKNKYGAKLVTDNQGVTWWEVNVKPEMKGAPVEAFKLGDENVPGNISVDEAKSILGKFFPGEENFLTAGSLGSKDGKVILGKYAQSLISLVEDGGKVSDKTLYHEAFHKYVDEFVSDSERSSILAGKSEEVVADMFADWMAKRKTVTGKVLGFFEDIVAKVKGWIGKQDAMREAFANLAEGRTEMRSGQRRVDTTPVAVERRTPPPGRRTVDRVAELPGSVVTQTLQKVADEAHRDILTKAVYHDAATGLLNKKYYTEAGLKEKPQLILDIDKFKDFNTKHTHATGDIVIQKFGELIQKHFPDRGIRFGGEEFTIDLTDLTPAELRRGLAELRADLKAQKFASVGKSTKGEIVSGLDFTSAYGENAAAASEAMTFQKEKVGRGLDDLRGLEQNKIYEQNNEAYPVGRDQTTLEETRSDIQETPRLATQANDIGGDLGGGGRGNRGGIEPPGNDQALPPSGGRGGKVERGFVTSVKAEKPELLDRVSGQYIPRSTDELATKAKNLIADDIETAERIALSGTDDGAVAIANELIKHYTDEAMLATDAGTKGALLDRGALIANSIARRLTELGRSVQAASILGRMTPEGQVRFAAREIQKYNEDVAANKGGIFGLRKKIPELTGAQADAILTEMRAIDAMPAGDAKAMRYKKFQDHIADLVPTSLYKKIVTIWKAGLLTGLKTTGTNIFANLSHGVMELAKDIPAAAVDSIASLVTKKRTLALTARGIKEGVLEGAEKGWRYLKTGFDERNIASKLDYKRVKFGDGPVAKALQKYEETVFGLLGAEDQPFYYGAKARSIYSQAIAEGKNLKLKGEDLANYVENVVQNPPDEMVRNAVLDAEMAVFQNETMLGKVARGIQKLPGGELILPFGKTPSAVATQIINYSPVGVVKTLVENIGKGKFDQRLFAQGLGRGLTGTGILAIGAMLFKQGLVTLERPTTEREQKLWDAEGRKPNSIKIGDKYRTVQVLGPAGPLMLIGGHFQRALEATGSPTAALSTALTGGAKSFTEQTFLKGMNQVIDAINDPQRSGEGYLGSTLSSAVPTLVSDVARAKDGTERRTETILDRIKARLPFIRESLEPDIDILGRERDAGGNFLEVMADPTRPSKDVSVPVVKELRRLWEEGYKASPTLLGDKNGYSILTPEQNTALLKKAGEITQSKLGNLIVLDDYKAMDDEAKAKTIDRIVEMSKVVARAGMAIELTEGLFGEELKAKLSELKAGKLLTQDVFKKYQEMRSMETPSGYVPQANPQYHTDPAFSRPLVEKPSILQLDSTLARLKKQNLTLSKQKGKGLLGSVLDAVRGDLPLATTKVSNVLKERMTANVPLTPEARKILKEIKIKDVSPLIAAPFAIATDKEQGRMGYGGVYKAPGLNLPRPVDTILHGISENSDVGSIIADKISRTFSPEEIKIMDFDQTTLTHELLHAMFERTPMGNSNEAVTLGPRFLQDWDALRDDGTEDDRESTMLWEIDEDLKANTDLYGDIEANPYSLATERFAYLGEKVARYGVGIIPPKLRKYYRGIFEFGK